MDQGNLMYVYVDSNQQPPTTHYLQYPNVVQYQPITPLPSKPEHFHVWHKRPKEKKFHCGVCNVTFNSQGQANTHFLGKRHAKVTLKHRKRLQEQNKTEKAAADPENPADDDDSAKSEPRDEKIKFVMDQSSENSGLEISKLPTLLPTFEETDEEKRIRLEMEADIEAMLTNLPTCVKQVERIVKPPDEKFKCKTCNVFVNSASQMDQHLASMRHKNTIAGIPNPPREKIEVPRTRPNQSYKCEVCNVTLNSEVQLLQHLRSQRHKLTVEGKPLKPRWLPYERFRLERYGQSLISNTHSTTRNEPMMPLYPIPFHHQMPYQSQEMPPANTFYQ